VRRRWLGPLVVVVAALGASCSSSSSHSTATTAAPATTAAAPTQPTTTLPLGKGVTATSIRVGVSLVDFNCIEQYTNSIRVNQEQQWNPYFDDINKHGGILGRQIVPVYETFCPIGNTGALNLCTKFTEDDNVFAVIGDFIDLSGDAETCVAKDHNTVLMTFELTQAIVNQSPPGMIIFPGAVPERRDSVLFQLLKGQHTLDGKTVGVLGETTSQSTVDTSVVPGLKAMGVQLGSTAILTITSADTSAAQSQLDAFIEKWKSEHVDTIFVSGPQVASQQFMEKLRAGMPNVTLITDATSTDVLGYGQQEQKAGRKPNPYEGMITIGGPTSQEYDQSANWNYCATIYQQQTGMVAPNAEAVVPGPNGKTLDTNGSINDACQMVTMFRDIATRVGPDLNNTNWVRTVDSYGSIRNVGAGQYASLHTGKYDVDDTFRLEEFNSSLPPHGQWQPLTPLEDTPGVSSAG
jgi:hypothetical protein